MILKPTAYLTGITLLLSGVITLRGWIGRSIYHHHTTTNFKLLWLVLIPCWLVGFIYILVSHFKYKTEYKPAPWLKLTEREYWRMFWGWAAIRFAAFLIIMLIAAAYLLIKFH